MRLGMVIDLKRCVGCYGCQLSCKAEHGTPPGVFYGRVQREEEGVFPFVKTFFLPLLCNHCEEPPCVEVCPTGATFKAADGIVEIDADQCVGCRTCMMACPYNNRYFNNTLDHYFGDQGPTPYEQARSARHPKDVVMKCDFCKDRVRSGKLPACVANCAAEARHFGDLDDPDSNVSRLIRERGGFPLHPEEGTSPSVYYLSPR